MAKLSARQWFRIEHTHTLKLQSNMIVKKMVKKNKKFLTNQRSFGILDKSLRCKIGNEKQFSENLDL